jgi:hypothetical protein
VKYCRTSHDSLPSVEVCLLRLAIDVFLRKGVVFFQATNGRDLDPMIAGRRRVGRFFDG